MGMKPRKQPPRAVGHRRPIVFAEYYPFNDKFWAIAWSDTFSDLERHPDYIRASGPGVVDALMFREEFEAREHEGRAVDLCAPGEMPGRG